MTRARWTTPLLALCLTLGGVGAQDGPTRKNADSDVWSFYSKKYDADGDGTITRKEYTRSATTWDAPGRTLRIHAGLEDPADLVADLEAGFDRFNRAVRESA